MNETRYIKTKKRILSIYPTYRGFGFTIFEDANNLLDWGHSRVEKQDFEILEKRINTLIDYYQPELIISQDTQTRDYNRSGKITQTIKDVKQIIVKHRIHFQAISSSEVKNVFLQFDAHTKYERATVISDFLPVLDNTLPPKRKSWQSEDLRMSIFDSASLALTYFYTKR